MVHYSVIFLILFAIISIVSMATVDFDMKHNKTFRFYTFMAPCGEAIKDAYIENVRVRTYKGSQVMNYDFYMNSDLTDNFKLEIQFMRCHSREALDSCETLMPFSTNYGCKFLSATNMPWTSFTSCSTPLMVCPIKKGIYKYRNCKLDLTLYNWMPLGKFYWRSKIVMTFNRKNLCFKSEGMIID